MGFCWRRFQSVEGFSLPGEGRRSDGGRFTVSECWKLLEMAVEKAAHGTRTQRGNYGPLLAGLSFGRKTIVLILVGVRDRRDLVAVLQVGCMGWMGC